jgi:DAK2 domain fusion protein YloV
MKVIKKADGRDLKEMLTAATSWLEKGVSCIDALNVFPVPDGDTGTNMLLTMLSSVSAASQIPDSKASAAAEAIAQGALIGARGNSGVILSQFWQGLAKGLKGKPTFDAGDLAEALQLSVKLAYKGVSKPVEGTILTVVKDISKAAQEGASHSGADLVSVMELVVDAARESVAETPNLLSVLREAGVVDAGGQGLYTILDGMLHCLKGETEQMKQGLPEMVHARIAVKTGDASKESIPAKHEESFGYCTEFLLKGNGLDLDKIREELENLGRSLVVVGGSSEVRVHMHTENPSTVIHHASSFGTPHQVSIRNMDEQHQAYLAMRGDESSPADTVVVAVSLGDGLGEVFSSLGAMAVIAGGQTMNPSTGDLLHAVDSMPCNNVIILPNNKNVVITARQVGLLTKKNVSVVPSETIPQGVSALLVFNHDYDFKKNTKRMSAAISTVKTIEIIQAVRSSRFNGFDIKNNQVMGFLDGELMVVDDEPEGALRRVMSGMDLNGFELVTLYRGSDIDQPRAEETRSYIEKSYPNLQVELIYGGQPYSGYIVSVE